MKYILIILSLLSIFSCNPSPKTEANLSEREIWEIKGKWRVQLEKFREVEKLPSDKIEIVQMDSLTYFYWKSISEFERDKTLNYNKTLQQ